MNQTFLFSDPKHDPIWLKAVTRSKSVAPLICSNACWQQCGPEFPELKPFSGKYLILSWMFGLASDFRVHGVTMKLLGRWCHLCKQAGQNQYLLYGGLTCVDACLSPFNSVYIHSWCWPGWWWGGGRRSRKGGVASLGYLCPYFDSSVDRWPLHPHWCSLVEAFLLKWHEEKNMSCDVTLYFSLF